MRLIEHDQCVGSEEAGVVWPHLAGCPIALEEKPGADHVDGAHDDGGRGGIFQPVLVVNVLTTESRDRQRACSQTERLFELCIAVNAGPEPVCYIRCLVDHCAPVHNIDEAAGQRRTVRPCDKPDRHHRGLAESCRNVARPRDSVFNQLGE